MKLLAHCTTHRMKLLATRGVSLGSLDVQPLRRLESTEARHLQLVVDRRIRRPISGEVGAAAPRFLFLFLPPLLTVSNPISGEVGAAAPLLNHPVYNNWRKFQTPSAGRWVLQQVHQQAATDSWPLVSNPISGEVGAAAQR